MKCEWCKCETDELHEVCLYNGHDIYTLVVCKECCAELEMSFSSNSTDVDDF